MKFNLKFKPFTLILIILGLILGVAVIVVNAITYSIHPESTNVTSFIITIIIGLVSIAICLSTLIYSKVIINDNSLVFRYGFLANSFDIKSITKVSILENSNKLVISYNIDNFFEASLKPKYFEEFSKALTAKNPNIIVEYTNG